ncbi:MAG: shikimate dehydrogenase [Phyllobacteriaceae bacterium]|nr:shikimate dehydrogenase [Phyllobacteriaceae bacterium]
MAGAAPSGRNPSVLVGLVGAGIGLSRTPAMHEAAAEALGIGYVYRILDTDRMVDAPSLADLVDQAERLGFTGLNVTYPYKQQIMPYLDGLSAEAAAVGAVNTVLFRDGRRIGHNTDFWGFRTSFLEGVPRPAGSSVLLVGAGGAGVAVAHALVDAGVGALVIHDKEKTRASALASHLASPACAVSAIASLDEKAMASVDGIVNATPVGMAKLPGSPVDPALIAGRHWVADIVYFPLETELLRSARAKGCRVMSGEGMAVHQAVKAFELFTGAKPDVARMRQTFRTFDRQSPAA